MAALLWDCQTLVCLYKKRGVYLQMRAGNIAAILMRAPSPAARVCNCFLGPPSSILHQLSAAWLGAGTALMIINTSTVDKSDKNCWQNYLMKGFQPGHLNWQNEVSILRDSWPPLHWKCLHSIMTNDTETTAIENTSTDSGAPLPDLHIILRPPKLVVNIRACN